MGKRILMLLGWYYPDSVGGTEVYVHALGKELQVLGWEVLVAAASCDEKEHNYVYDGLPVFRYPITLRPTKAELRSEVAPEYFDVFKNWLEKNKPDIVHIHSYTRGCGFFHVQYVKKLGFPLVLTIHTPELTCVRGTMMRWGRLPCDGKMQTYRCTACYLQKRGLPRFLAQAVTGACFDLKNWFRARKESILQLFNFSDHIVVVAIWLYEVLRKAQVLESKISICLHGLPPGLIERIKTGDNFKFSKPIRIGFIGRFNYIKGVHILIKAIKRLPKDMCVEFRLYGRTNCEEDRAYFKKIQKLSRKDSRILFCGEVTDGNRQEVLSSFDILAVPSLWLETGPFVVLEAYACGIPVMGSNLGGIVELVTDRVNGLLIETGNVLAWAKAISWIDAHPEALKNWMQNIPPVCTTKEVTQDMLKIYKSL